MFFRKYFGAQVAKIPEVARGLAEIIFPKGVARGRANKSTRVEFKTLGRGSAEDPPAFQNDQPVAGHKL